MPGRRPSGPDGSSRRHGARVARLVVEHAEGLIVDAGLTRVDVVVAFPITLFEWSMSNIVTLRDDLGDRYPACEQDLTIEVMFGLNIADHQGLAGLQGR